MKVDLTLEAPVTFTFEGLSDESSTGTVTNIGPGGCLLKVDNPMAIGSKLTINFNVISLGSITLRATVYHVRKQDRAYYVRLFFENLPEETKNDLIQWVHEVNSEIVELSL